MNKNLRSVMLTLNNIPMVIYSMTKRRINPKINALSALMFVIVLTLLVVINVRQIREQKRRKSLKFEA